MKSDESICEAAMPCIWRTRKLSVACKPMQHSICETVLVPKEFADFCRLDRADGSEARKAEVLLPVRMEGMNHRSCFAGDNICSRDATVWERHGMGSRSIVHTAWILSAEDGRFGTCSVSNNPKLGLPSTEIRSDQHIS